MASQDTSSSAGIALCDRPVDDGIGIPAPFELQQGFPADALDLLDNGVVEQGCRWALANADRRVDL